MFNTSKYTSLYFSLISKYQTTKSKQTENHHIIPKSCSGTNDKENIVALPARVHFILHRLLPKMLDDKKLKQKMIYANWRMMNPQSKHHVRNYIVTSHDYNRQRALIVEGMSGKNNPMKRPEISNLFRRKRPEQSAVATKRNLEYWSTRKAPILQAACVMCSKEFIARNAKHLCCCGSCAGSYRSVNRKQQHPN